jgi:hypothetical protein
MKNQKILTLLLLLFVGFSSCKKEFDAPPIKEIPEGQLLTIQDLHNMYDGSPIRFDDDYSVYATVTMDDRSGNIYRNAYIQDGTNAIVLRTNFPGGLYAGDSIRVYLKGITLNNFNGMMQLDSVNVDKNIIKQATKVNFVPEEVTVEQLITNDYRGKLVKVINAEFQGSELGNTYANAQNQQSMNRTLVDCDNNQIIVRTSGFADFANQTIASGNGTMVAIANEFNGTKQLLIRSIDEVQMNEDRCTGGGNPSLAYLFKDFSDADLYSGGWSSYVVESNPGTHDWGVSNQGAGGNYYAVATGWNGSSADETDLWLISPAVNLADALAPQLTFRSSTNFNGPAMQLFISTDYDGTSDPLMQGTWTNYSTFVTLSPGGWQWTNSGIIPLLAFVNQSSVYIAFRYTSGSSGAATWQVDDILIDEN